MAFHFIKSKLTAKNGQTSLNVPLVIDIQGASTQSAAKLDAFAEKSTGNDNQQWEFNAAGSGYYTITSKLDLSQIAYLSGGGLSAAAAGTVPADQCLWRFVQDPAGSGYYFIQSKVSDWVIDIKDGSQQQGAELYTLPARSIGNDNQLWQAPFPSTVGLPTSITFYGPGPGTHSSGSTEYTLTTQVTINQDGTCEFWGSYTNRGDTVFTAPPQNFGLAFIVHDLNGNGYAFGYGGFLWSAPQEQTPGHTANWNFKGTSKVIADNWVSIACRYQASFAVNVQATEGAGASGDAAPAGTVAAVLGLIQSAASSSAGSIDIWLNSPNTIFCQMGSIPALYAGSGTPGGDSGGSLTPGWVPSGASSTH